jgi:hypothetical protein
MINKVQGLGATGSVTTTWLRFKCHEYSYFSTVERDEQIDRVDSFNCCYLASCLSTSFWAVMAVVSMLC